MAWNGEQSVGGAVQGNTVRFLAGPQKEGSVRGADSCSSPTGDRQDVWILRRTSLAGIFQNGSTQGRDPAPVPTGDEACHWDTGGGLQAGAPELLWEFAHRHTKGTSLGGPEQDLSRLI